MKARLNANGDLLQFALSEKPHQLPVGREERLSRIFRAGDGAVGLQAIHLTQVKLLAAASIGDVHEVSAVGREGHGRVIQIGQFFTWWQCLGKPRNGSWRWWL